MTDWIKGAREREQVLSRMIFRILCWNHLVDYIDGGVGFFGGPGEERDKSSVLDMFTVQYL